MMGSYGEEDFPHRHRACRGVYDASNNKVIASIIPRIQPSSNLTAQLRECS